MRNVFIWLILILCGSGIKGQEWYELYYSGLVSDAGGVWQLWEDVGVSEWYCSDDNTDLADTLRVSLDDSNGFTYEAGQQAFVYYQFCASDGNIPTVETLTGIGNGATIQAFLYSGNTLISSGSQETVSSGILGRNILVSESQFNNISDWNNLELRVICEGSGGSPGSRRGCAVRVWYTSVNVLYFRFYATALAGATWLPKIIIND